MKVLGNSFLRGEKSVELKEFMDRDVIALYFSGGWCPNDKNFNPLLLDFYKEANSKKLRIEIVFVSHDKRETTYTPYQRSMPWVAIP